MKTIKYFFEFITVITLFFIFKIIGLKNASNLGGVIGKFFGPLFRSKSITKENIKIGTIYFVDEDTSKDEWTQCDIVNLFSSKPKDDC